MSRWSLHALCLSLALVLPVISSALTQEKATDQLIDDILGNHAKYKTAITAFQNAVKERDAEAVAAIVNYPIVVKVHGKDREIKSARAFARNYDGIMTPEITKAVLRQKYDDLVVNWQSVMFGDGQVWMNGICKDDACKQFDVKVITIQSATN